VVDPLMDDALRRANPALGRAQCEARDKLLLLVADLVGSPPTFAELGALVNATARFKEALTVAVPVFDQPPTKPPFVVHDYELEHLAAWHHDQEYEWAGRQDYTSAEDHKRRQKEIREHLK
jgi:hypothetical protein